MAVRWCTVRNLTRGYAESLGSVEAGPSPPRQWRGRPRMMRMLVERSFSAGRPKPTREPRVLPRILLRSLRSDESLEARISSERIEHWIEPEQRGSERCTHTQCTPVGDRE
jgi:hypothetical protein